MIRPPRTSAQHQLLANAQARPGVVGVLTNRDSKSRAIALFLGQMDQLSSRYHSAQPDERIQRQAEFQNAVQLVVIELKNKINFTSEDATKIIIKLANETHIDKKEPFINLVGGIYRSHTPANHQIYRGFIAKLGEIGQEAMAVMAETLGISTAHMALPLRHYTPPQYTPDESQAQSTLSERESVQVSHLSQLKGLRQGKTEELQQLVSVSRLNREELDRDTEIKQVITQNSVAAQMTKATLTRVNKSTVKVNATAEQRMDEITEAEHQADKELAASFSRK